MSSFSIAELDAIEERERAAHVGRVEPAERRVLRLALRRVDRARRAPLRMPQPVEVRIALEHDRGSARSKRRHAEGAGADGVVLEEVAPLLAVPVLDRLPGHRRREGHREPVEQLRIGLGEDDLELVGAGDLHARDPARRGVLLVDGPRSRTPASPSRSAVEALGELAPALDLREGGDDRARHRGIRDPHQLEGDVAGHHLARAGARSAEREGGIVLEERALAQAEAVGDATVRQRARRAAPRGRVRESAGRDARGSGSRAASRRRCR